jgi:dihydrodipicolinate synthase/N-acetylneuraminate lyase
LGLHRSDLPRDVIDTLRTGTVIPAHPLALDADRRFNRRRQRALTRYYVDAGAGGLAVGVHTTQFAIREAGLLEPVLAAAVQDSQAWTERRMVLIAGICGPTAQAVQEAKLAVSLGYHAGLISLSALRGASGAEMLAHCARVADEIPLVGFYLQPAVGGVVLDAAFWQAFCGLDNAVAIKVAPFNRYRTLDVVRGLVLAGAEQRITLYTGNDDHIVLDLAAGISVMRHGVPVVVRFRGGLLGHWSVWTRSACQLLQRVHAAVAGGTISADLLTLESRVLDCNSAFFDAANGFRGCIAGCHEVLRRQGLLAGTWCLDPEEALGPGQQAEIERVCRDHSDLSDDTFVTANLERWLQS